MSFFSVNLFKKCLDKKVFYPTVFITYLALVFWNIFDLLIPTDSIGKNLWAESLIFSFGLLSLSFLSMVMKKKNEEKIEFAKLIDHFQPMTYLALFSLSTGAIFLFVGMFLQFLQKLPFLGLFFKVVFCSINFAFYLLEPMLLIAIIGLLFCLGKRLFSGKKIALYHLYEEILSNKGQEALVFLSLLKASLPFIIFGWFFSTTVEKIVAGEKTTIQFLMKLVLYMPISLLLSPFVNYFFFFSFLTGEKNKVERQDPGYAKVSR